jgi:hypothetical protein
MIGPTGWRRHALGAACIALASFAIPLLAPQAARAQSDDARPASVPIFYNDRNVYAKPDRLKHGRVLAALVRDGQIYVPLRSMFEAMGATVSASTDGRTITAVKAETRVSVTVGVSRVLINGEARPLDVAPIVADGIVLVPVRVISEALGAYVAWIPERHIVVIRLLPAPTAPPAPVPTATAAPVVPPPVVATAPPATPIAIPHGYTAFVQAAYARPENYNEFVDGVTCPKSYVISGAIAPLDSRFALKVDFRQDIYVTTTNLTDAIDNQYTQFTTIGGGTALTNVFQARQSSLDGRLEYRIAAPRIYVGVGYLHTENNYGYPQLNGVGFGVEKLPELRSGLSIFGSAFYYPSASGTYGVYRQSYAITKYDVGLALAIHRSPVYLYGGYDGDRYTAKTNAPIGQIHDGPYAGLGVKL